MQPPLLLPPLPRAVDLKLREFNLAEVSELDHGILAHLLHQPRESELRIHAWCRAELRIQKGVGRQSIYIYLYIYIYIYTYTHTHIYIYTYLSIYLSIHTHVNIYLHTHTYIYIYVCVYIIYMHLYLYLPISMYVCMYICMYIYIYTLIFHPWRGAELITQVGGAGRQSIYIYMRVHLSKSI